MNKATTSQLIDQVTSSTIHFLTDVATRRDISISTIQLITLRDRWVSYRLVSLVNKSDATVLVFPIRENFGPPPQAEESPRLVMEREMATVGENLFRLNNKL